MLSITDTDMKHIVAKTAQRISSKYRSTEGEVMVLFGTVFIANKLTFVFSEYFLSFLTLMETWLSLRTAFPLLPLQVGVFTLLPAQALSQLFSYPLGHRHLTLDFSMVSLSLRVLDVGVHFSLRFLLLYSLPVWLHHTFPVPSVAPTHSLWATFIC